MFEVNAMKVKFYITLISIIAIMLLAAGPATGAPIRNSATKYAVVNGNATAITVQHTITNTLGFNYTFWATVPASSTMQYRLTDMPQVPSPFNGILNLESEMFFQAHIVGYEWSGGPTGK